MSKSDRVGRFMGKLAAARGKLDESSEAQNSFDAAHAAIGLLPRYRRVADIHQKRISALSAVVSITRRSRVAEPILFSAFPAADAPPRWKRRQFRIPRPRQAARCLWRVDESETLESALLPRPVNRSEYDDNGNDRVDGKEGN